MWVLLSAQLWVPIIQRWPLELPSTDCTCGHSNNIQCGLFAPFRCRAICRGPMLDSDSSSYDPQGQRVIENKINLQCQFSSVLMSVTTT